MRVNRIFTLFHEGNKKGDKSERKRKKKKWEKKEGCHIDLPRLISSQLIENIDKKYNNNRNNNNDG